MLKESLLRQVSLFADLPDADLKQVATIARSRNYRKQEVIFHAEDSGRLHDRKTEIDTNRLPRRRFDKLHMPGPVQRLLS